MSIDFLKLANEYKDEAIKLLNKVLSFNTVLTNYDPNSDAPFGKGNKECLNFFLDNAKNDGFNVLNCDNYAGHVEYGEGKEILGVLGHLDVVPTPGEWLFDPFTPTLADGKIYARGAADDKGPVIAAYIGLKMIKDLKLPISKKVRLIVGCDEESGSRCLEHYFKKEAMPDFGFSPDADYPLIYGEKAFQCFVINGKLDNASVIKSWLSGERTNIVPDYTEVELNGDYSKEFYDFLAKSGYSGKIENGKYITFGKNAHGSIPQQGLNSNYVMADFINSINPCNFTLFLDKYFSYDYDGTKLGMDIESKDMGHLSLNPGVFKIENGNVFMHVDCRVPSNDHFDVIKARLAYATSEFGLSYELDEPVYMHYVDPNSDLVQTLYGVYKEISKDEVNKPFTIGGGTYAKFIDKCVAFGPMFPGDEECIHCPNEYITVDSFVKNIAIYAKSIYELVK